MRALVLGGYGAFGRRVAERLARVAQIEVIDRRTVAGWRRGVRDGAWQGGPSQSYPRASGCGDTRRG